LHIAMRIPLDRSAGGERLGKRPPRLVLHPLRHRDNAASAAVKHRRNVVEELRYRKGLLGRVDEMGRIVCSLLPGRGRGSEKARMASHDDADINAGHCPEIEVNAGKGIGDESSGRDEARDMVVGDEIVVDSLWRMDELERAGGPASQQFKGS